jgi:signal transduction histidine kinase
MKKPGIIFTFLSVYIVVAFSWWTYSHIDSANNLSDMYKERLELLCYKATLECNGAVAQEMIKDTSDLKKFFHANWPELEIIFDENLNLLENYMIRPKQDSYTAIENKFSRKINMYLMEGVVMVLILFWGIIWIYRSLLSRLQFNRTQNNFLLSVTHELKTPLASIKLYLETLMKRELSKEQSQVIITNSISDANRLKDLVENILIATQLDSKRYILNNTNLNISETITNCIEKYALPRNLKPRLICNIQDEIYMLTDQLAMETVVINLLSNAEKYGPADGKITIDLRINSQKDRVLLSVTDEGNGISETDKKKLFGKFFRVGDESVRKTKGTGLGLFIVKNLLNLMKGEITVKDNQPKGTTFELSFII